MNILFDSHPSFSVQAQWQNLLVARKKCLAAAFIALAHFFPSGVSACSAVSHGYTHTYRDLEQCGGIHFFDNDFTVQLEGAFDLGLGFVRQRLYGKSTGCIGREVALIVMDCTNGVAVAIGGYHEDDSAPIVIDAPPTPLNLVSSAIAASISLTRPLSISQINELAADVNVNYSVVMTTTSPISMDGFSFQLGCACQLYYPDSPGASQ